MDIEAIRSYCLSLPDTEEDIKWEDHLCFTIGKKIYCLTDLKDPYKACVKVSSEDFQDLTQYDYAVQAAYMAKGQWVLITDTAQVNKKIMQRLLRDSYLLVRAKLPQKQKQRSVDLTAYVNSRAVVIKV
jgi:predicted DNA-binding protein (MmcQ/YjbR family)